MEDDAHHKDHQFEPNDNDDNDNNNNDNRQNQRRRPDNGDPYELLPCDRTLAASAMMRRTQPITIDALMEPEMENRNLNMNRMDLQVIRVLAPSTAGGTGSAFLYRRNNNRVGNQTPYTRLILLRVLHCMRDIEFYTSWKHGHKILPFGIETSNFVIMERLHRNIRTSSCT